MSTESNLPESWMRGDITDVHPLLAQVLYTFRQALEELDTWAAGLSTEQIWMRPFDLAPIGFHMRHMAGSAERLLCYSLGKELTAAQLTALRGEMKAGADVTTLLQQVRETFTQIEKELRRINPEEFEEPRGIGRKKLPSTVAGLLIHIAEHTQRHLGQAINTCKVVKGWAARDRAATEVTSV
jgi:hypothetical protein